MASITALDMAMMPIIVVMGLVRVGIMVIIVLVVMVAVVNVEMLNVTVAASQSSRAVGAILRWRQAGTAAPIDSPETAKKRLSVCPSSHCVAVTFAMRQGYTSGCAALDALRLAALPWVPTDGSAERR